MAQTPIYLKIWKNVVQNNKFVRKAFFTDWPTNAKGRPVTGWLAHVLFKENATPTIYDSIPNGATGSAPTDTEGMQGVTNQDNHTTDFLDADGGYAMTEFPTHKLPDAVATILKEDLPYYNNGTVTRERAGKVSLSEFAKLLKPYMNSTSPTIGVTVNHQLADVTITANGDQVYQFPADTFSGADTYTATKSDGSTSPIELVGSTRSFKIPSVTTNQTFSLLLIGTNSSSGQSQNLPLKIIVARTVDTTTPTTTPTGTTPPFIASIIRKYDPASNTIDYVIKSSLQATTPDTLIPVWRCKRSDETNWRGDFSITHPSSLKYGTDVTSAGYLMYCSANLSSANSQTTTSVFQIKPYATAPDDSIITLTYQHGTNVDYGTEVFSATNVTKKITYVGVMRYPNMLSVVADGSGVIKTQLIASGSTQAYANGEKVMTTDPGGYQNNLLYVGSKPYGSLYGKTGEQPVPIGTYILKLTDEDGKSLDFPFAATSDGPIAVLLSGTGVTPTQPIDTTTPTTTPTTGTGTTASSNTNPTAQTVFGKTVIGGYNLDIFTPSVSWSNGKARVIHNNPPSGGGVYIMDGGNDLTALPTTNDFLPGDETTIFFKAGQTTANQFYNWDVNSKASVTIKFGDAPTV